MMLLCLFASILVATASATGALVSGQTLIDAFKIYSISGTITFLMTPIILRCAGSVVTLLQGVQDARDARLASSDRS